MRRLVDIVQRLPVPAAGIHEERDRLGTRITVDFLSLDQQVQALLA